MIFAAGAGTSTVLLTIGSGRAYRASEPGVAHVERGAVQTRQQIQLRPGPGQFVAEEVACRLPLSVVEVAGPAGGGDHLLEPHPGDDDVAERLQVDDAVGQGGLDVTGA